MPVFSPAPGNPPLGSLPQQAGPPPALVVPPATMPTPQPPPPPPPGVGVPFPGGNLGPVVCDPPAPAGGFLAEVDYLLLRPLHRATDFAVVGVNPNWGPIGVIHNVDGGFDSGFRVGAGYGWGAGGDVMFRYTNFHASASETVNGAGGNLVFPTLTDPAVVNQVASARGQSSVNVNLFDLEAGARWQPSDAVWLRFFAGPRLANLDQTLLAVYSGGEVRNDVARRSTTFTGAGLRAGAEANYFLSGGLGVYARGSGSLLVGRFRSDLSETANRLPIVSLSETFTRVVPVIEVGIGLSYQVGAWRFTAGYEIINWFGMVDGLDVVSDVHPGKIGHRTGDLGFDGFMFRAQRQF
jgi:hypothetical protein